MENINIDIGIKIQQLRLAQGLSQQALATRVKKSKNLIAAYEKGKVSVSMVMIKQICDALGEDPYEFINGLELND